MKRELRDDDNNLLASSAATRPATLSFNHSETGTYRVRVVSLDYGTPSYSLEVRYPVEAYAPLSLRVRDPGGAVVHQRFGSAGSLDLSYEAPAPGGQYELELVNTSSDTDVPSYDLTWKATLVSAVAHEGSLEESAQATHPVQAEDAGAMRLGLGYDRGVKSQPKSFSGTVSPGGVRTHAIEAQALGKPIEATLSWGPAQEPFSHTGQLAVAESESYELPVGAAGQIWASVDWSASLANLFMSLRDPSGNEVASSDPVDPKPRSLKPPYDVPEGNTGTYTLTVTNLGAASTTYSLDGDYPVLADLDLELLSGQSVVATGSGTGSQRSLSHDPQTTGTYSLRVTSNDRLANYSISARHPILAFARVELALVDPSGQQVGSVISTNGAASLAHTAEGAGEYAVVVNNTSSDTDVPSYTLSAKAPSTSHYADVDLELLDANGQVVATSRGDTRPEVLALNDAEPGQYRFRVASADHEADWELDYAIPEPAVEQMAYDALGRVDTITDASGVTAFAYDVAGREITITPPGETPQVMGLDAAGRLTSLTDAAGDKTFSYDARGLLTRAVDAGVVTTYAYDVAGNEELVTHDGASFSFGHDAQHRFSSRAEDAAPTVQVDYEDLVNLTSHYNEAGWLIRQDDPRGLTLRFVYDRLGRQTRRWGEQDQQERDAESFAFDEAGNMLSALAEESEIQTTFVYDEDGRITQVTQGQDVTTYAYDGPAPGKLVALTDPTGGTTTYAYDANGMLETLEHGIQGIVRAADQDDLHMELCSRKTIQAR